MSVLNKYIELEGVNEVMSLFKERGDVKEYKRNDFFARQGQENHYAGFILEGGFRYLGYTSEGKEQIVGYSFENDFVVDYGSFQIKKKAIIGTQAIRNSTVLLLGHDELNDYYNHSFNKNLRGEIAEVLLEDIYERLVSMYCDSPKERYIKLIKRYPEILNLITLKEIASLIKVTPETLSRIRRKL